MARKARNDKQAEPVSVDAAPVVPPPAAAAAAAPAGDALRYALVCTCFTLSGVAALVYQTAWTREFALVFGTSELAVATVLAAYMAGLALGARGIEWLLPRVQRPVQLYAWLELLIGAAAVLLIPAALALAEKLLVGWFGGQAAPPSSGAVGNTLFYLVAAFLVLLVPTVLMGATLPLLVRDGVHSEAQIGSRIGRLYACNTAGAVVGALLTAFVLLPALGLRGTIFVGAAVNGAVFLFAWWLARMQPVAEPTTDAVPVGAGAPEAPGRARWILPLVLLSGAVSFCHEVLWTRLLARVIGSSIQAFGVMVASFLLGIALGGALGARLAQDRERAARWFAISQVAVAAAAIAAWYALLAWGGVAGGQLSRALFGLGLLLPLSLAIGVSYPLAVRVLASGPERAAAASARVYSWNTAGAIAGALAAGFWLIPALRYEGAVQAAVWLSCVLAIAAILVLAPQRRQAAVGVCALAAVLAMAFWPAAPLDFLKVSALRNSNGQVIHYAVGRSADVVVVRDDAMLDLRTNGLPEAGTPVLGAPPTANVEAWMPMLAVLARPDTADMLIVGFGGGNAALAVPPSVQKVDVIELEPKVIEANRAIAALRLRDPLTDLRLNIIDNDARGALLLTDRKYDAIVSQPSHPWTAGASHLYTREFMRQAHAHLREGGVFVQWMGAEFIDAAVLRSLVATLREVFAHVHVYRPSGTTLILMGSDQPIDPERQLARTRATFDRSPLHYARVALTAPEDLIAASVLDDAATRSFAAGARPLTDDDNQLATANIHARRRGLDAPQLAALLAPFDPLTTAGSFVYRDLAPDISFDYLWRRIVLWSGGDKASLERMSRVADVLGESAKSAHLRYMMAMHLQQPETGSQLLAAALQRWPDDQDLLYLAAEAVLGDVVAGRATPQALAGLRRLTGERALVVQAKLAAARNDWETVSRLDAALAAVPWHAQVGALAAEMRTEWRVRVQNPELRQRLGDEGIAIADLAEVSEPNLLWHARRAWSAAGTNRPEVVLESAAAFNSTMAKSMDVLTGSYRAIVHRQALLLLDLLKPLADDRRIDAERYRQVVGKLNENEQLLR